MGQAGQVGSLLNGGGHLGKGRESYQHPGSLWGGAEEEGGGNRLSSWDQPPSDRLSPFALPTDLDPAAVPPQTE